MLVIAHIVLVTLRLLWIFDRREHFTTLRNTLELPLLWGRKAVAMAAPVVPALLIPLEPLRLVI